MEEISLLSFAVVSLVTVATPGPDVILTMSNGSRYGVRRAGFGIVGVALSDAILIAGVGFGLGAVLAASEMAFNLLRLFGIAYLGLIGVMLLRARGGPIVAARDLG